MGTNDKIASLIINPNTLERVDGCEGMVSDMRGGPLSIEEDTFGKRLLRESDYLSCVEALQEGVEMVEESPLERGEGGEWYTAGMDSFVLGSLAVKAEQGIVRQAPTALQQAPRLILLEGGAEAAAGAEAVTAGTGTAAGSGGLLAGATGFILIGITAYLGYEIIDATVDSIDYLATNSQLEPQLYEAGYWVVPDIIYETNLLYGDGEKVVRVDPELLESFSLYLDSTKQLPPQESETEIPSWVTLPDGTEPLPWSQDDLDNPQVDFRYQSDFRVVGVPDIEAWERWLEMEAHRQAIREIRKAYQQPGSPDSIQEWLAEREVEEYLKKQGLTLDEVFTPFTPWGALGAQMSAVPDKGTGVAEADEAGEVEDKGEVDAGSELILEEIESILFRTRKPMPISRLSELSGHYGLSAESLRSFFTKVSDNLLGMTSESPKDVAKTVDRFLETYRGRQEDFDFMIHFIWNDYLKPIRSLHNLEWSLEQVSTSAELYQAWGVRPPTMTNLTKQPLTRERIGFSGYFVEIWPGSWRGGSRSGLAIFVALEDGTKLVKVGVMFSGREISITQIQGKGPYLRYKEELWDLLGGDPFNWVIEGLSHWASMADYERMVGYGHSHNAWIEYDVATGRLTKVQKDHLGRRMYEGRYENSLQMDPMPDTEGVFFRDLSQPDDVPIIYESLIRSMEQLAGREHDITDENGLFLPTDTVLRDNAAVESDPFFISYEFLNDYFGAD